MFPLLMPKIMMMYEIKPTTRPVKRIIEKFAQKDYNFKLVYHEKLSVLYVTCMKISTPTRSRRAEGLIHQVQDHVARFK